MTVIRSFSSPVLFNARSLRVYVITLRSPLFWRRLAAKVRAHPQLARRGFRLELVVPGGPVPHIWISGVPDELVPKDVRFTARHFLEGG